MQISSTDDPEDSQSPTPLDAGQTETLPEAVDPLSSDEPLRKVPGSEQISLLVQSPERLFLHWNHARDPHATLRKALGEVAASYRLAVRLVEAESGEEILQEASDEGMRWFDVKPGRGYRAEVGFVAAITEGRPFIRLLSSELVQTPRKGVSHVIDDENEFQVTAPDFASVLSEAGYAADALEVALEAADDETDDRATQEIVSTLTDIELPSLDESSLVELRALIVALALGRSPRQLLGTLSAPLAGWLEQIVRQQGGMVDSSQLLEMLRATFGFELEFDERFEERPTVLGEEETRSSWGASLVHFGSGGARFPVRTPLVWLPSMAPRLLSKMLSPARPPRAPSSFTIPRSARLDSL